MESSLRKKREARQKRAWRVRGRFHGTAAAPRLCVIKSNAHIALQLINDDTGSTLLSTSTYSKEFKGGEFGGRNKAAAAELGRWLANKAKDLGIQAVVLDRGYSKYHGILAALADAAREGGLQF
jgi:large subunit ribosomal protein L18